MSAGITSIRTSATAMRGGAGSAASECEWRLPSGEDLIAFALATGFAAGPLAEPVMGAGRPDRWVAGMTPRRDRWSRS